MLLRKIRFTLIIAAGGLITLLSFTRVGHAQTIINDGYISSDTVWDQAHSPYIIEDQVYVPQNKSLIIGPGTTIIASSSLSGLSLIYVQGGRLQIGDDRSSSITFSGDSSISISHGKADIFNTVIDLTRGILSFNSVVGISSTTINRADLALRVRASAITIRDSSIKENRKGIYIENPEPGQIFPVYLGQKYFFGGEGNMTQDQIEISSTTLYIDNSNLVNNIDYSIKNDDTTFVTAKNNWWGQESGPSKSDSNKIIGNIYYEPWTKNPNSKCCSNIVFIPGIEASRLYNQNGKNRLWEPNRNEDVKKLILNTNGSSTSNVLVGDLLYSAYSLKDIYGNFAKYLDSLVQSGLIKNWFGYSYDWRKSIEDIAMGNENRLSETEGLVDLIISMASTSPTGKVSLISHSNGGLIMKYVSKILKDRGLSYLLDKTIGVGVPYLGTPSAIAGILHGDGQSIAEGLLLKQKVARDLGLNMSSAYSLLPSENFFQKAFGPTIAFASTSIKGLNNSQYPEKIINLEDQTNFILDKDNSRQYNPKSLEVPAEGNSKLLALSLKIHSILDYLRWENLSDNWSIFGWNRLTTKGIKYDNKQKCKGSDCGIKHENEQTIYGDGTVTSNSSSYDSNNLVSIDLEKASKSEDRNIDHSNIMGASTTIKSIDKIIKGNSDNSIKNEISKIDSASIGIPYKNGDKAFYLISTHSPVDLHVYDSRGKHVGINSLNSGDESIEPGFLTSYDQDIVGSSINFEENDDGTNETYIYLPNEIGQKYNIEIRGNNFGNFTYQVEKIVNENKVESQIYSNIPVSPFTIATTSLIALGDQPLNKATKDISLDFDGDGSTDQIANIKTQFDDYDFILKLRKIIDRDCPNISSCKNIKARLDKIQSKLKDSKSPNKQEIKIAQLIGHKEFRKTNQKEKEKIYSGIEDFLKQFE